MEFISTIEKHLLLTTAYDIDEICKPIKEVGITFFSFVRSYKDSSHIRLSNNPEWSKHYYTRGFYNYVINNIPDTNGNILWSTIDKYPFFFEAAEYFNVDNGTVIVLNYDDITERYFFGATRENKFVNNIYIYNIEILKKFIVYFKYKAMSLIKKSEQSKIIIPDLMLPDKQGESKVVLENLNNSIISNNVVIRIGGKDIVVSLTEAKILACMKKGLNSSQMSSKLSLKQKTIEIYRANLKQKIFEEAPYEDLIIELHKNALIDLDILSESIGS